MTVAAAQLTAELFLGQPMLGVEYGLVARVCLPDWIAEGALRRPADPVRAISIRAMAASLGSAPESTRRHVHRLRDLGVFAVSAQGISLATLPVGEAVARRYYLGVHDLFIRLLEDMADTCDVDFAAAEDASFGIGDVIERALDTLLLPIDTFRLKGKSRLAFLLWGALSAVAVRDITYDPGLSRQYADAMPPDALRRGISLRPLAASMSIPYATAWRQIQALKESDLVTRLDKERWTVLTGNLMNERASDASAPPTLRLLGKVRELARMGFDPARAADHYRVGRPALANLGGSLRGTSSRVAAGGPGRT